MLPPNKFEISLFNGNNASDNKYVDEIVEVNFKSIELAILSKSWSPGIFKEIVTFNGELKCHRSNNTFKSAQIFGLDIDGGLSLSEAVDKIKSSGFQAIIGTTKSHGIIKKGKPACDRFRIIFFLSAPIQNEHQYLAVFNALKSIFPMCDNCKDSARFFYPCREIILNNNGKLFPVEDIIKNAFAFIKPIINQTPMNNGLKSQLSQKTKDFIAFGAPDHEWHSKMIASLYDLKQKGFTQEEATLQMTKASLSNDGQLDDEDHRQIHDVYHNRVVDVVGGLIKAKPQPLFRELSKPELFPVEVLGSELGSTVKALVKVTKAPLALCAQSVLAAVTLAVQPFRNVIIDGRILPISQFFLTIGDSGERKSAVDGIALKMHREFEKSELDEYRSELHVFNNMLEVYNTEKKKIINIRKSSKDEITQKLDELGLPPLPPPSRMMIIQEPTFEGIIKMYENGRPSLGLFSDEGGRMVGGYAMSDDNQLKTISGFCTLWDGKPLSKVRSESGSAVYYNRRFSIHLMFQSVVAQLLLGNKMASGQGFLARCLTVYPESTVGTRIYESVNADKSPELINYHQKIKHILNKSMPINANDKNELAPTEMTLNDEAKQVWVEFHNYVEVNLAETGQFQSIREFGAKAAEHSLRLAAVMTLFENIDCTIINKEKMESATKLVKYYLSEALRLNCIAQIPQELLKADKLLKWCHKLPGPYVYSTQVYKNGPNSIREKTSAKQALKILEDHGHLKKCAEPVFLDDATRHDVWEILKE